MVRCARAWSTWEMNTCKLMQDPVMVKERMEAEDGRWAIAFARIEWYVRGKAVHLSQIRLYPLYTVLQCILSCVVYIYVLYFLSLYLQYVSAI